MRLESEQQETITEVLEGLERCDIRYVVLRGHEDLPNVIQGSDIDLFIDPEAFDNAIDLFKQTLKSTDGTIDRVVRLAVLGVTNPSRSAAMILNSPGDAVQYVWKSLTTTEFSDRNYVEHSFGDGDLDFHIVNHLAYKSTLDGSQVRVDPEVETAMLNRRVDRDGIYIPSEPDELAHLLCRGIFDYDGTFPRRYQSRCDELYEVVRQRKKLEDRFRTLLSKLFYDADTLVYDLVAAAEYDSIRSRLRSYADY